MKTMISKKMVFITGCLCLVISSIVLFLLIPEINTQKDEITNEINIRYDYKTQMSIVESSRHEIINQCLMMCEEELESNTSIDNFSMSCSYCIEKRDLFEKEYQKNEQLFLTNNNSGKHINDLINDVSKLEKKNKITIHMGWLYTTYRYYIVVIGVVL